MRSSSLVFVAASSVVVGTSAAAAAASSRYGGKSASASSIFGAPRQHSHYASASQLAFATVSSDVVEKAKKRVLSLATNIKEDSKTGVFIANPAVKSDLKRAVADLEAVCGNATERSRQLMIGDWTLLCSTNSAGRDSGDDSKKKSPKLPFKLPELPFQDKVTKSIQVTQRIRSMEDAAEGVEKKIDRVDNVIEFTPFANTIGDLLGDAPAAFKDLKLNPLEVSNSKLALIHKANVESITPVLRTKIALQSYVLTVAGTSQYLEPEGADLLGLNVPLGEFQSGKFDTTYVDEELRISRGKVGLVDVLRVFVRKGMDAEIDALIDKDLVAGTSDDGTSDEEPTKLDELRDAVEGVADAVQKANDNVREILETDMEKVQEKVDEVVDSIKDASEDIRAEVEEDVKNVVEAVEGVADVVIGEENRKTIEAEIEGQIKNVQETAEDVSDSLKEIQEGVEDAIGVSKDDDGDIPDDTSDEESKQGDAGSEEKKEDDAADEDDEAE